MSYKITDTDKWNDTWFNTLSPHAKLLFIFLCENCDNAGIYEINEKFLLFLLGINREELKEAIIQLDKAYINSKDNKLLWIKNYLRHQKKLPLNRANNNHKQVIMILEQNLADPDKFKGCKEMHELIPVNPNVIKTEKAPVKRNLKKFEKPTVQEVLAYMKSKEFKAPKIAVEADKFFSFYESNGWKIGKNKMQLWRGAVSGWMHTWYERNNVTKPSKMDNVKESHDETKDVDWNEVYKEPTT